MHLVSTTSPLPPPPPALPLPTSSPTQTIVVNLPPEVIDKLGPHQSPWLTQPIATVVAATIALLAAAIAYHGLRSQLGATAAEARKDRDAAAELARKARRAELELVRNAQRQTLIDTAVTLLHGVHAASFGGPEKAADPVSRREFDSGIVEAYVVVERMRVSGLERSADAFMNFLRASIRRFESGEPSSDEILEYRNGFFETLRDELDTVAVVD